MYNNKKDIFSKVHGESYENSSHEKIWKIAELSIPASICMLIQKSTEVINLSILGHQEHIKDENVKIEMQAGAGLGNMT